MPDLTHFDDAGNARMVDVGQKPESHRVAIASGVVHMEPGTLNAILDRQISKGDVLGIARIAGLTGTKRTADLIPLCHPLRISSVDVAFETLPPTQIRITATVQAVDRTGVEMEALTAVSTAALTIYDMCKSMDRTMRISDIVLEKKTGGKSGDFVRDNDQQGCDDQ